MKEQEACKQSGGGGDTERLGQRDRVGKEKEKGREKERATVVVD